MTPKKNIVILGSTGSIGTQTLQVLQENNDIFDLYALTAHNNIDLLVQQARIHKPEIVVIANETLYTRLKESLSDLPIKVFAGSKAIAELVTMDTVDIIVAAMVGYAGLESVIQATQAGKRIALANKETLVVAGEYICNLAKANHATIIPIDSEHSAIFQCLTGEEHNPIEKIMLTASGGPFLQKSITELKSVTSVDALQHPTWNMGAKITIDSASLMNKGFEVIEATWLFGVPPSDIEVVVHPQSIIHSMVQFADGSIKAQLGLPDMKLPIHYAINYPHRIKTNFPRFQFNTSTRFTFDQPDLKRFRNLALAYYAIEKGGNMPCVLNAANEVVVAKFLKDRIGFLQMSDIIETVLEKTSYIAHPQYEDYVQSDTTTRLLTNSLI